MWVAHCGMHHLLVAASSCEHDFHSYHFCCRRLASIFSYTFRVLSLSGWSLEMILNVTVTAGIVYRIWQTGQQTAALTSGGSFRYKGTIIMIVESGALIAACTCVIFCLWAAGNIAGLVGSNIAVQVTVSLQFLSIYKHDDWSRF